MGVSGLLPLLKSIHKPTELKKCHGQTLGVDAYGWLHRAAFSCAVELGQGKPTTRYVASAMHRVRMLLHFGIKPYMVFDGDYLPSKAATEDSRAKKREEKKKLANDLMKAGKPSQAAQEFQKCVDITPEMASTLIQELKKLDISYIVAPYEADSQLVYLERQGLIDGILSDDSDLLVFGAQRLLTKLDQYGNCIEINRRDFGACREISLSGWSDTEFRRMAIMSGCDYLNGLPGVGLKTAYRMMRKSKSPERVVRMLQFDGKRVSENYLTQFYQAELTFLHQWVFCPTQRGLVHLTELDGTRTAAEMPFIGAFVEPAIARRVAAGDVNPITKEPIVLYLTPSKRKLAQTKSYFATPAPKQPLVKAITSFFKTPSRKPMGEMDPNCFSVDAARVAQLTDGGLVPVVFPLPRPYIETKQNLESSNRQSQHLTPRRTSPRLNRRRTDTLGSMVSHIANIPLVTHPNKAVAAAAPRPELQSRPQKKARLCEATGPVETSPKRSKFFSAKKLPAAKTLAPAQTEDYLYSDDSVEAVLKGLPEMDSWEPSAKTSQRKLLIFEDAPQEMTSLSGETRKLIERTMSNTSRLTTADTSRSSLEPPSASSIPLLQQTKTPICRSLGKFTYTSSSSLRTSVSTPASSVSVQSSVFSLSPSTPSTAASSVVSSRMTPLQYLGAKAVADPLFSPSMAAPRPRAGDNKSAIVFSGKPPQVNPAFVPLPKVDIDEVEALHKACDNRGSEDQIIPDSDSEHGEEYHLPAKRFNPLKFTFR
ncbi:exonuclease, putative [Cordyceps militaris CM01]|uniref:Exonuclease, putative n=1 Tax=Cordyceps militaris (strain CM01) TaxID=983644 RepID=G3JI00_CORMM|nr:exonuclease, putative [Cordyceps militaris CM01]EGX91803.1 exonuclease, putative [Cordyceps militaris CM01]